MRPFRKRQRTARQRGEGGEGGSIEAAVQRWQADRRIAASITKVHRVPATEATYGEFGDGVSAEVRIALEGRGVERPYSHQSAAWSAVEGGGHVVVVTPTASGKTLCYNVPVLSMLSTDRDGCALYLYPTKALAQDQCAELNELLGGTAIDESPQVYDGDTPADIRRRVRQSARIVLSNPDMLHASILPNHELWRRFFASLKYVVIDEMHVYRGVFGSHVGNVMRRLQRICRHYGSSPQFVMTSATIANPAELGEALIEQPVTLVNESGAPTGEKLFVVYNPPIADVEQRRRQSPGSAVRRLLIPLLEDGHSAIVFTRSRQGVEILSRRLKETFEDRNRRDIAKRIESYRGGYLPSQRRRIERGLRAGEVQAVVSTNALELGIDIGSLDVCVIAGYPGTIASTWQQAGRAGRRQSTSLCVLVARDTPVDQYLVNDTDYLFGASPEHGRIDANNLRILAEHLKCAAFEMPFGADEGFGRFSPEDTGEVLAFLSEESQLLTFDGSAWRWSAEGYPATEVSLRDIPDENFVIIDTSRKRPQMLGEIDFESAHKTVYENAIYQHAAQLYEVHRLDYKERKAYVRSVKPDYFTQAVDQTRVFPLDVFDEGGGPITPGHGEVRIVTRFPGFKKILFKTFENIGYGKINLPDLEKHTTSYWATFDPEMLASVGLAQDVLGGALQGIGTVMRTVAVVHMMATLDDLLLTIGSRGGEAWNVEVAASGAAPTPIAKSGLFDEPTVFLYDRYPGGVGFSERLFDLHDQLLTHSRELIARCSCTDGCPSCVGPATLVTPGGKAGALTILDAMIR